LDIFLKTRATENDAMRINCRVLGGMAAGLLFLSSLATNAQAANAYPVVTDINVAAQAFGAAAASSFGGLYTLNDAASLNGNSVLSINQKGQLACCHGALIEFNVSNGENGVNSTEGGANVDVPNATPANPVFAAIGNASGKLEAGNVIRFSAWFRSDPANPITQDPQVQPILKIEYWKEALSSNADSNGTQAAPGFGDRIFDQDQQGSALGIPDLPTWVDLNNDGVVLDAGATVGNGRVKQLTTTDWTLVEVTHTVNPNDFLGIGGEGFGGFSVDKIEAVKGVMFVGDFNNTNLTGDGADGGNMLVDNALMEVFKDAAALAGTPNTNPKPTDGLLGDYNHNSKVDAADYVVWRNDQAGNGGAGGYDTWRANFGNPPGSGSGAGAVPEPSVVVLAACVAAIFGANRRRGC
jgi:hypothetical protein